MEEARAEALAARYQETLMPLLDQRSEQGLMLCADDNALTLLYANQAVARMLGLEQLAVNRAGENPVLARMTAGVRDALMLSLSRLASTSEGLRVEARFGGMQEMPVWVLLHTFRVAGPDGPLVACLMQNVTQLRWAQELLKQERNRNEIVTSFSDQVLFEYALSGSSLFIERPTASQGRNLADLFDFDKDILTDEQIWAEDRPEYLAFCARMRQGVELCEAELRLSNDQQSSRWVSLLARAVRNSAGHPIKYIGRLLDIHESKLEIERLIYQAQRDPLTQLYNRNIIQGHIESQLTESVRANVRGAIAILDIDNFKQINDQQGHFFGDFVLQSAADLLRDAEESLPGAMAGRLGGDEFLLLLPNVSHRKAEQWAQKLLLDLTAVYCDERGQGLSCSIGIAEYPACGQEYQEVFQKADAALYLVKSAGKAGYRFYRKSDDAPPPASRGFYNTYQMDDSLFEENITDVRQRMVRMVSETLNRVPKLEEALPLVLRVLGRRLGVDRVAVVELDESDNTTYCAYQWPTDALMTRFEQCHWHTEKEMVHILEFFSKRALQVQEDFSAVGGEAYLKDLRERKVSAFVHYATFSENSLRYIFQFEHYGRPHSWSRQDLATIKEVSDALSNHLLRFQVRRQASEQLNRHLNYDSLTRLPTLPKLIKDAERLLENWREGRYAIIYADFRGFKQINDLLGYVVGDQVLRDFADVVRVDCSVGEQVCRVSGDAFIGLLHGESIESIVARVNQLSENFTYVMADRHEGLEISLSIGLYLLREDDGLVSAIDNANTARKMAKRLNASRCVVFDDELRRHAEIEGMSISQLERALAGGEFIVCFQPKVRLDDRAIAGAEALVRWRRPDGALLPPDRFVPSFEASGVITRLDHHVLETACRMLRGMLDREEETVQISVNLSRRDYRMPRAAAELMAIVDRYELPHHLLEFELTESIFIEPNESLRSFLRELLDAGCDVSIDDFGYGYSSLNILAQVPASVIKLDRAFLVSSDRDERSRYILEQMVTMAHNVGLRVVCEGIEREEQAEFCRRIGCDLAQGFLFARAVSETEFLALLKQEQI